MLDINNPEINFAINAVHRASALVQTIQSEMVSSALTKDDRSPVTVADFAAQALVGQMLDDVFPKDAMIGEEDSSILQTPEEHPTLERITQFVSRFVPGSVPESICTWIDRGSADYAPRYWTLDPIDGTKGFLRGDQYAVALALVVDGRVQVGVLGCPKLNINGQDGVLIAAARGQGSWMTSIDRDVNFKQLKVSSLENPVQARLLRSFESGHTNTGKIDIFAQSMGVEVDPIRMDSQAKYGVLAAGLGEIYLRMLTPNRPDYKEKIWDQAAGSIVIEEAGGRVTDLHGKQLNFTQGRTLAHNRGICATNGLLHDVTLNILEKIQA